jgi:TPR repeat protein
MAVAKRTVFLLVLSVSAILAADFAAGTAAYEKGDYATARKEWEPLAEEGSSAAQYNLGLLYYNGQGAPQDFGHAAELFQEAADQGYPKAQHNLGAMYGIGKGVRRDYIIAYKWLNLCAAAGEAGCAEQRDLVAKKLSGSKLAQAQRMSRDWTPTKK